MPFREMSDGTFAAVRTDNRPVRSTGCTGMGCAPGMGEATAPALSRTAQAALAAGAQTGDRAARFAIEAVRSRGLSGMGAWVSIGGQQAKNTDNGVVGFIMSSRVYPSGAPVSNEEVQVVSGYGGAGTTTGTSEDSWFSNFKTGADAVSNIARQGIDAYGRFTQGPAPRPVVSTGGPSTGMILGVLGAIAVVGLGIAVAMSMRGKPVRSNRRRNNRRGHRSAPKYYVQGRMAA